jgi:putative endonuclease
MAESVDALVSNTNNFTVVPVRPRLWVQGPDSTIGALLYRYFMASIYILFSQTLNRFYIGSCKDLTYRINQHFNKEFDKSFTAKADDWTMFLFKDDLGYEQARLTEQHIKKMKSRKYIKGLKDHPELLEKLIKRFTS